MTEGELDKEINDFLLFVNELFPYFEFGSFHGSSVNGVNASGNLEFSLRQKCLKNTIYTNTLPREFLHFTSIDALCSIMNENTLRLYNIDYKNDSNEFTHIFKKNKIDIQQEEILNFRTSLHTLSLCKNSIDNLSNSTLWERYGKKGKGVAIVLELLNEDWNFFILGQVFYRNNKIIKQHFLRTIYYIQRNKNKFNQSRMPILIGILAILYKRSYWQFENEFRLISFLEYDKNSLFVKEEDHTLGVDYLKYIANKGKIKSYVELYLDNKIQVLAEKINEKQLNIFPRFKIKSIVLGDKVSDADYGNLKVLWHYYGRNNHHRIESIYTFEEALTKFQ
jgi:hypothetical protein